jgi:hypothetical protein
MTLRYRTPIFTILILGLALGLGLFAQDEKREIVPGADFQHPIYLPLEEGKPLAVKGIGDNSKRPAIIYIVRLNAGQQLTAKLTSSFDKSRGLEPFLLYLFDAKTTSLVGSGTTWILQRPASPDPQKNPKNFVASFNFASPDRDDYYVVPIFQDAGILFTLEMTAKTVSDFPGPPNCVSGPLTKPIYVSPGVANSLIADITVGGKTKADKLDAQNRRFCIVQACSVRPPSSVVLTIRLRDAFDSKRKVKACWGSSETITEVVALPPS